MQKYVVLNKPVGQTPLECVEHWRERQPPVFKDVPLAYAGRLDPMASGKLLVLIGDECKHQERYHGLDKQYEFSVLFGVSTDTQDVLGRIQKIDSKESEGLNPLLSKTKIEVVGQELVGSVTLPYPHFSSKTVRGKPLHVWTLEGRLNEITIPTKTSTIYKLRCTDVTTKSGSTIYQEVLRKIEAVTPVTDVKKALGNDFRRVDVRNDWQQFFNTHQDNTFTIATFTCIASSGTYMRTLAETIARDCHTVGLAYSIHRSVIGRYWPLPGGLGIWSKRF